MASRYDALVLGCVLAFAWPSALRAQQSTEAGGSARWAIAAHVREASQRFGIPEHWIYAVIRIESAGRMRAVSSAGAMGLMQLMPRTWARQRGRFRLGDDPFDPRDNIMAGTSYLREMYDRYGAPGFLAAYNAGPGRYQDWLAGRRSLPLETRRYVAKIGPMLQSERIFVAAAMQPERASAVVPPRRIFAAEPASEASGPDLPANPFASPSVPGHDLFAPVSATNGE